MIRKITENLSIFFWPPKPLKIELWRSLGGVFGEFWGVLGSLSAPWARVVGVLARQRPSWGRLGAILGRLGWILAGF